MAALLGWAVALAWVPARLWPRLSLREGGAATVGLAAIGAATWLWAPANALPPWVVAMLAQTAAAVAWLDIRRRLIADLYSVAVAALALATGPPLGWLAALGGAALGAGLLAGVRAAMGARLGREAMGWGDVKLAAALGLLLGPVLLLWTVAIAAGLGAAAGLVMRRSGDREPRIPFGALLAPVGVAACWWASRP